MSETQLFGISDLVLDGNGQAELKNYVEPPALAPASLSPRLGGLRSPHQMRRALVVGLGGTGVETVTELKARLIAQFGQVPDGIVIRAFDTANEPAVVQLRDGRAVSLEPGTEFLHIGNVPTGRIAKHRERQAAINERFGESLTRLPPTVLLNGARQVRLLGLLALYWHFLAVEEHLKRAIWHLAGRDNRQVALVDTARGLNVFIINSYCGGTGAGTFLDVAYTIRALVEELGDLGEFCQITNFGVLPGAFRGISGPNILPNAVASLVELNHAMTRSDFHASYPSGRVIDATTAPFDLCYLIDGVDEHGGVWRSIHDVCRMVSEAVILQMASQLGQKGENDFDNLREVIGGFTSDGHGTFFGSVGLASFHFDAHVAYAYCARRQVRALIQEGWCRPVSLDAVETATAHLVKAGRLSVDALAEDLALDEDGVRLAVDLTLPGRIRRLGAGQQAAETVNFAEDVRATRLRGTFPTAIEARSRELEKAQADALRARIALLAGDPNQGVGFARALLDRLEGHLATVRDELETRQADLLAAEEAADTELNRRREALLVSGLAGFLLRAGRVGTAQRHYLDAADTLYTLVLDRLLCTAALRVVDHLAGTALVLSEDLARLEARLDDVTRLLDAARDPAPARGTLTATELFTPEYGDRLYDRYPRSLADTAQQLCACSNILSWHEGPADELAIALCRGAGRAFEPVLDLSVETVLAELNNEATPQARLQALLARAVPSWTVDRARLPNGGAQLARVDVLGVPNTAESCFADHSGNLVSTHDKSRIVALRVTMGAPYTALQQFPDWLRRYEEVRGQRVLHVLPSFHSSAELALRGFAVGLIFDLIYAQGSWYYYRPKDKLDAAERLANGLENAVRAFAAHEGLAKEVMDRVERQITVNLTTAQAVARLDAYWQAGDDQGEPEGLDRKLRRAAREYADELREIIRVSEGIRS